MLTTIVTGLVGALAAGYADSIDNEDTRFRWDYVGLGLSVGLWVGFLVSITLTQALMLGFNSDSVVSGVVKDRTENYLLVNDKKLYLSEKEYLGARVGSKVEVRCTEYNLGLIKLWKTWCRVDKVLKEEVN